MTLTSATDSGSCDSAASQQSAGATRPCASTGSQLTSAPSCATSHSTASSTAWCSIALTRCAGAAWIARPPSPEDALDRQVVGLGAAGGEDHLGRPGADAVGDCSRASSTCRRARRPAVQRRGVADLAHAPQHGRDGLGQHRRRRSVIEVRHRRPALRPCAVAPAQSVCGARRLARGPSTPMTATRPIVTSRTVNARGVAERAASGRRDQHAGETGRHRTATRVGQLQRRRVRPAVARQLVYASSSTPTRRHGQARPGACQPQAG